MPVLVTRLPDRSSLARLVRAALRHEVAQVALAEAPRKAQAHTLDLRVEGTPTLALLAEPAGAPQNGHFPLRLRPLHRAQAAQLYALLEAENVLLTETSPTITTNPETQKPESPVPDTVATQNTLSLDSESDSDPILRAMSGSAPPPAIDIEPRPIPPVPVVPRPADPRKTTPSASFTEPLGTAPRREEVRVWSSTPARPSDDPRRTAPSASWADRVPAPPPPQQQQEEDGSSDADEADPSLSVSVVFEPDGPTPLRPEISVPADLDGPSLSVSVVFEPDSAPTEVPPPEPLSMSGGGTLTMREQVDSFFDDALLNLPPITFDEEVADTDVPPEGSDDDDESVIEVTTADIAIDSLGEPVIELRPQSEPPPSDDDDAETLIRLPNENSGATAEMLAPLPAAGMPMPTGEDPPIPPPRLKPPSVAPKPENLPILAPENVQPVEERQFMSKAKQAQAAAAAEEQRRREREQNEEFTPTKDLVVPQKKQTTGSAGRKRKTTRRGKTPEKRGSKHRIEDDDTAAMVGNAFTAEEPSTNKRKQQAQEDEDPLPGRKIADGKYVIDALIGSGAAGAVYKATHRELRRTVAVKVLHPHYQQDPHFMKSFRGEALAASQLDHPNVMRVLDFGQEPDGLVYIVMEFLSGRTLQSLLDEERRLPPDRAVEIMIQVCAALSVAHDNGIIHRDIKPDNIMLVPSRNDEGGTFELVKVCDFGIAALQNPSREDADLGIAESVIAGTPEYMSPEQARGSDIDARADVYACGICLYELVTGRPPFLGDNAAEILIKQLEETPKPPSQIIKGLDPILEEIILRAIQKDSAKRQQSARELRVELKELLDPGDGWQEPDDELSIVENVPVLDDPASGFPGFFIAFSSAIMRFGRFERGHPEAPQALKELQKSMRSALRGRSELTFARRDTQKTIGFCVMSGTAEIVDLRRLLGSQLYGSFGEPFIHQIVKKGIASLTLREGLPEPELSYLIEMLLGPYAHEELRKELFTKPLRHLSLLFVSDVVGRERKLSWKVGLCASRLARDLRALSNVRGISLKKMRESREDLVGGIARILTRGDEVRQFLFNADLVDDAVANLRGFSSFQVAPLIISRLLHDSCAEAATLLIQDFDRGELDPEVMRGYLRLFAERLVTERSPRSDAAVAELYKRSILTDADMPRDLKEQIRATSLADALVREPGTFLRTLDLITDPNDYAQELLTLEAAMAVLARRAEAGALLAAISALARHAKTGKTGPRENAALRTMKSMIDKARLVPIATTLLVGPPHQREAARQLIVLAGSAGAQALYMAREGLTDASARPTFVKVFRETGPAGWSLLSALLPRMEVRDDAELALVEDLLRAMPDRQDPVLGEAVAKFLAHPRLRPAALAAIVPLWGERARKPLVDALEFAEEPARIVAVSELRRIRAIDEHVVGVIERLLTMRGSASEELRAAAAAALADVPPQMRVRVVQLLSKGVEGKRGFVAMLRGDGNSDESVVVLESMARALLALDRNEGLRALKGRISRSDGITRARLSALLQMA